MFHYYNKLRIFHLPKRQVHLPFRQVEDNNNLISLNCGWNNMAVNSTFHVFSLDPVTINVSANAWNNPGGAHFVRRNSLVRPQGSVLNLHGAARVGGAYTGSRILPPATAVEPTVTAANTHFAAVKFVGATNVVETSKWQISVLF